MSVSERRGTSSRSGRQAARDDGSRLPCLDSDNCSETKKDGWYEGLGSHSGLDDFIRHNSFELSPYHKKAIFALRLNLEAHIDDCGVNHVGFMTVSFKEKVFEYKQATKLFHSFVSSDGFCQLFGKWYRVAEQHKDGSWHLHLLVECREDIRTGFDWDHWSASKKLYRSSRGKSYAHLAKCCTEDHPIRVYWQRIVRISERSKMIGRCQMEPLKSNSEGCGKYLSKYLDKGFITNRKKAEEKGAKVEKRRLVGKGSKATRAASSRFAWVSEGGRIWRAGLAQIAEHFELKDLEGFSDLWGPRWAYHLKDWVHLLPYRDLEGNQVTEVPVELMTERFGQKTIVYSRVDPESIRRAVFESLRQMKNRWKAYEK